MKRRARQGDTVSIRYIGTLDNGRIFDSTEESGPLTFTIGGGKVFPALEEAVVGMAVGEAKNLLIPAADAYGPRRPENQVVFSREKLPAGFEAKVGQKMQIRLGSGEEVLMLVTAVDEAGVTLDGNHALAGLDLTFALQLDAIVEE